MNHILKIGVELEGGWQGKIRKKSPFPDITIHADASIHEFPGIMHFGEIASPPMRPIQAEIEEWITTHYPAAHDHRCGFHVHVSVTNARIYGKLATRPFFEYWRERTKEWAKKHCAKAADGKEHPIWHRLRGENKYCRMEFSAINQMRKKTKPPNDPERRTALNFCWGLHRTIENRVYPMFDTPKLATKAVFEFTDCINTYLDQLKEEKDFLGQISLDAGDLD